MDSEIYTLLKHSSDVRRQSDEVLQKAIALDSRLIILLQESAEAVKQSQELLEDVEHAHQNNLKNLVV